MESKLNLGQKLDANKVQSQIDKFYPDPVIEIQELPTNLSLPAPLQLVRAFRRANLAEHPIIPGYFLVDTKSEIHKVSESLPIFVSYFAQNPKIDKLQFAKLISYILSMSGEINLTFWPSEARLPAEIEKIVSPYQNSAGKLITDMKKRTKKVSLILVAKQKFSRFFGGDQSDLANITVTQFVIEFKARKVTLVEQKTLYEPEDGKIISK